MEKYFKLTNNSKVNDFGIKLFQIELTKDCKYGKKGELHGWIEKESNLKSGIVSDDSEVWGDAVIFANSIISGNSMIFENSIISDSRISDSRISGNSEVSNSTVANSMISGSAIVSNSRISDDSRISGNSEVSNSRISGGTWYPQRRAYQGTWEN